MKSLPAKLNPNRVPNLSPLAWAVLGLCLLLLLGLQFAVHHHSHFGWEDLFGFYAIYGFIASAGLVIAGNLLGKLLKRPEGYYRQPEDPPHDD